MWRFFSELLARIGWQDFASYADEIDEGQDAEYSDEIDEDEAVVCDIDDEQDEDEDLEFFRTGDHVMFLDDGELGQKPRTGRVLARYYYATAMNLIVLVDGLPVSIKVSTFDWPINGPSLRLTERGKRERRQRIRAKALQARQETDAMLRPAGRALPPSNEQVGLAWAVATLGRRDHHVP